MFSICAHSRLSQTCLLLIVFKLSKFMTRFTFILTFSRLKFRNYVPQDKNLRKSIIPRPEVPQLAQDINEKLGQIAAVDPDYEVQQL